MSSQDSQRLAIIELTGRVLGILYHQGPQSQDAASLYASLADPAWHEQWPVQTPELTEIASRMTDGLSDTNETLSEAYQRLFIGPHALPAAPWGSVYLDKENVLFGDSTLELRRWMRKKEIGLQLDQNEPEDHIGTLLMLAAWLAESGHRQLVDELLAWHLLPWAGRFLELFIENAGHPFYQGLGELTRLTLANWREGLLIPVAAKELHF
ncbi:Tat proofreading chaperone DmsD [Dryocola sp. BD626]|uniref:Tat proofreading chaperone DmsD n=1 Tax=Dryocola sp. BD626 TaxID=3133273 RepID=UPI003F50C68A